MDKIPKSSRHRCVQAMEKSNRSRVTCILHLHRHTRLAFCLKRNAAKLQQQQSSCRDDESSGSKRTYEVDQVRQNSRHDAPKLRQDIVDSEQHHSVLGTITESPSIQSLIRDSVSLRMRCFASFSVDIFEIKHVNRIQRPSRSRQSCQRSVHLYLYGSHLLFDTIATKPMQ